MPNGSLVHLAQLNFTRVDSPSRSLLVALAQNLHHLLAPRLTALTDKLVESTPAGSLVDGGDAGGKRLKALLTEALPKDMTQGDGTLLAQTAVEFLRTFGRGTAIDADDSITQACCIHGLDAPYEGIKVTIVVFKRQIDLTLP